MDKETFSRKERLLKLKKELEEVEESRAAGDRGYSIEEIDEALSRTIDGIVSNINKGNTINKQKIHFVKDEKK